MDGPGPITGGAGGGGGGATIPNTANLIKGDGAGNGADSGVPLNGTHIAGVENNSNAGGILNMDAGAAASSPAGDVNTSGSGSTSFASGGSINTSGVGLPGGGIDTSNGGGSIYTRETGSIELGNSGTRTTLTGTASTARAIALPDADGTIFLNGGALSDGTTATTQADGDNSTKVATTEYVDALLASGALSDLIFSLINSNVLSNPAALASILSAAGITPAADGTSTPVTSVSTVSGIVTGRAP